MRPVWDEFVNFVNGVTTSPSADSLPDGFSPRGRNTTLVNIGQGSAQIGPRKGLQTGNTTPISGSNIVLGQYQLKRLDGSKIHLLVNNTTRLDKYNSNNTTSVINAAAFTSGNYPNFATVNNFAIIANGTDLKKTDGTTVFRVGMVRPAAPTAAATAGGAMSAGAWDVALTYFNSTTGEESSLSDFTTATLAAGNLQINISWSAPADPQVDFVRVYLRKQTLGPNTYLVIAGLTPAPNATWEGFPVATLATVANVSDTVFGALTIIAPTINSNDPPASTLNFPVWHNQRLFLFDQGHAYYSNITNLTSNPESFNPLNVEAINPADGDTITGAVSAFGVLLIFKKYSLWMIDGYDPSSWSVVKVAENYGCCSHRTIVFAGGTLYWWANSSLGLLALTSPQSQPLEIGKELLSASINDVALNTQLLFNAVSVVDEANDLIYFSLPEAGATIRNTLTLPFNYRVKRFVADGWTPMDIASFAVVEATDATKVVYAGGYSGQIFKLNTGTNDGVRTGTSSGLITAAAASTLTDGLATFDTTGGALIERYVYHIAKIGGAVQRRRITGNTGTVLTVTPAWNQNPVVGDSYVVGGIDWQIDTPWRKQVSAFVKKRFELLSLDTASDQTATTIYVDVFLNDNIDTPVKTLTFMSSHAGAIYDTSVYDAAIYASTTRVSQHKNVGLTGRGIRFRLRQLQADKQVTLQKLALQSSILSLKS